MLCMTPSSWVRWGARDEAKTDLVDGAGRPVTYTALVERAPATVTAEQAEEVFAAKLARTGAALDTLAARIDAEGLDAMIVVGDDQAEHLEYEENLPPCSSTTAPRCATLATR